MDKIGAIPGLSPRAYGTLVHTGFAAAVRLSQIPGIGFNDVETSFRLGIDDPPYGLRGSVRTDVLLRDDVGDIAAIYDVKTGAREPDPARVRALRLQTGVGSNIPVIEMSIIRGLSLRYRVV
jgi:hypothetical protein